MESKILDHLPHTFARRPLNNESRVRRGSDDSEVTSRKVVETTPTPEKVQLHPRLICGSADQEDESRESAVLHRASPSPNSLLTGTLMTINLGRPLMVEGLTPATLPGVAQGLPLVAELLRDVQDCEQGCRRQRSGGSAVGRRRR